MEIGGVNTKNRFRWRKGTCLVTVMRSHQNAGIIKKQAESNCKSLAKLSLLFLKESGESIRSNTNPRCESQAVRSVTVDTTALHAIRSCYSRNFDSLS